jgi:hypothetical protein
LLFHGLSVIWQVRPGRARLKRNAWGGGCNRMACSIFFRGDAQEKCGEDENEHSLFFGSKNESGHHVIFNGSDKYGKA